MPISIKNESLSTTSVPGKTKISFDIKSSYNSAKVEIKLKSNLSTVKFKTTNSKEIVLDNDYSISNSFSNYSKENIELIGSTTSDVDKIGFTALIKDSTNNESTEKDISMPIG